MYDQSNLSNILKLMTIVVLPSISKNYVLNRFSYYYGYFSCMCYQMIMNSYVYLFPIVPNLGYYLNSIVMFLIPLIINVIMENIYPKKGKRFHKKKDLKKNKIINIICIFLVLVIVGLCSNLFPYWIATIGSGSMSPTINVGDAIIIDKTFAKNLDRLQVGDILVFKVKDSIYTHRIVDIHKKNNQYQINTKGDRKGNVTDNWVVTDDGVVGVVKCKIPYIGYPTVILNQMIEKNKKEGNNEK